MTHQLADCGRVLETFFERKKYESTTNNGICIKQKKKPARFRLDWPHQTQTLPSIRFPCCVVFKHQHDNRKFTSEGVSQIKRQRAGVF